MLNYWPNLLASMFPDSRVTLSTCAQCGASHVVTCSIEGLCTVCHRVIFGDAKCGSCLSGDRAK